MTKKMSEEELLFASQLRGAGIPLYDEVLEAMEVDQRGLSIRQTGTIADTRIFDLDSRRMALMLSIAICNGSPRIVWLHEFRLEIPWWEPHFRWLEDPTRKVPRELTYSFPPPGPVEFERDVILNHRLRRNGRLVPNDSIEGFLLGVGEGPMPSNYRNRQPLKMRIWVLDERGNKFGSEIMFLVDRRAQRVREKELAQHESNQMGELSGGSTARRRERLLVAS